MIRLIRQRQHYCLGISLLILIFLSGCREADIISALTTVVPPATPTATSRPTPPTYTASYEKTRCKFRQPLGKTLKCGTLIVPEDRRQPDGPQVRLHVAILSSPNRKAASDPIVYLEGGPGGSALELLWLTYGLRFTQLSESHDLIFFDQRGIGLSEPTLDCPEIDAFSEAILDQTLDADSLGTGLLEATFACQDRLAAEGINLAAYNSATVAADLHDLRLALGYETWNIYGTSYGTRAALTTMRDYGTLGGIRSVILDSTYPLESNLYLESPANTDRALRLLFNRCAIDSDCQTTYPALETVFYETVAQFNKTPTLIEIVNPLTGETHDMLVHGDDILDFLFQALYATEIIPSLPQIIYDLHQDDLDTFALLQGSLLAEAEIISYGMHYSVQCHEEVSFSQPGDFAAAAASFPHLQSRYEGHATGELLFPLCERWDAGQAASVENQPVHSDIPTLIIAGEFDPVTPPSWGQLVADKLSNAFFVEIPNAGHGSSFSGACPRSLVAQFLADPTQPPDTTCLQGVSFAFITPNTVIDLVPFKDDTFAIQGVVPAGWQEIAPGTYSQGVVAINQQAGPPSVSFNTMLSLVLNSLGVDETLDNVGTHETPQRTWILYQFEFRGNHIDLAAAQDERPYIVMLQAPLRDRERLYEQVFLAALDALRPLDQPQ